MKHLISGLRVVAASASGLDPHIISVSPIRYCRQVVSPSKTRDMSEQGVIAEIDAHTEGRALGLLGEPRVQDLQTYRAHLRHTRASNPAYARVLLTEGGVDDRL